MQIEAALLCDAATMREGLLHMLGGPISRIWRPQLPAPLGVALAVIVGMDDAERAEPHEIQVTVRNETKLLVSAMGALQVASLNANVEPGEIVMAPFAMALHSAGTDGYGRHSVHLSLDAGAAEREIPFWVLHPDERQLPPMG